MVHRSLFPFGHQSYMLWGYSSGLHGPLCCGGFDYFVCAGRKVWPLTSLAAKSCLMSWLLAHWWLGWVHCVWQQGSGVPGADASPLVGREAPNTNWLEKALQNGSCQEDTSALVVEWAPKLLPPTFMSPGESQWPFASSGGSPRTASGSYPGSFQIIAFVLGLGVFESLCTPFKISLSFLQPSSFPICKPHWPSKPSILVASLPVAGPQGDAQTFHSSGRTSTIMIILPFLGDLHRSVDLDYTVSQPPTYFLVVPSLYLLLWVIFSTSLQVILINSNSVNSYNFAVPMGRGKLRVFLLCCLGHTSLSPPFYCTLFNFLYVAENIESLFNYFNANL